MRALLSYSTYPQSPGLKPWPKINVVFNIVVVLSPLAAKTKKKMGQFITLFKKEREREKERKKKAHQGF